MSKDIILEVVTDKFKELVKNNEMRITADTTIESIGINSIDIIKLLVFLEDTYDIEFDDDDLMVDNNNVISILTDKIYSIITEK